MPHRGLPSGLGRAIVLALALSAFPCVAPAAERQVSAITIDGDGEVTRCRSWILFKSCRTYRRVELPPSAAVGDKVPLRYGSSPKTYDFPVGRIDVEDEHCTIYADAGGHGGEADKIVVNHCQVRPS